MEWIGKYITEIITGFIWLAGASFWYLQTRKPKYQEDIDKTNSAVEVASKLYTQISNALDSAVERNKKMDIEIDTLRHQNELQREEIETLRRQNKEQLYEMEKLKKLLNK